MKLTSTPKPVNFRIVLKNNTEITSIELLQRHFDFERFFVTDKTQFISWLKRKDEDRGNKIEQFFNPPAGEFNLASAITQTLNIIYSPKPVFKNMVDFVNFLYDNNENNRYEVVKSNFSDYISNQGELLHKLFPIDSIRQVNNNLEDFYGSLNATDEVKNYLSQLYYRHGRIVESQRAYPLLWKLDDRERKAIKAIISGSQLKTVNDTIASGNLSIIGVEFIFLSVIAYLSIHWKDNRCKDLSELIDEGLAFKPLRESIGGSLKKLINKKNPDFFKVFVQLGYAEPNKLDPLFNEKLFLSSFFAEVIKRDVILKEITEKTDYFPAHYLLGEDGYESKVLKSRNKLLYKRWLSRILDYYDNHAGLDGDDYPLGDEVREMAIIAHQFKDNETLMNNYFHFPNDLDARTKNSTLREHINHIKSVMGTAKLELSEMYGSKKIKEKGKQKVFGSWASDSLRLSKKEKEYISFFNEVVHILDNWEEYIFEGCFTSQAESMIKKYRENNQTLQKEKLFVVTILLLIRDHNTNRIYEEDDEIKKLRRTYVPLKALFENDIPLLSLNDKKILQPKVCNDCLRSNWLVSSPYMRDSFYRRYYYERILRRWIANFVYYTE